LERIAVRNASSAGRALEDLAAGLGPVVAGISVVRVLHAASSSRPISSFFNSSSPGTVVRT
jgi:hypothetical protein